MSRPKYLTETLKLGPLCRHPRRKLVMKAELPHTPASQARLRSARSFGVQRRARVVHGHRPFPLKHLGYFTPLWLRHFRHNAWKGPGRKSVLSSIFWCLPLLLHSGSPGRCRISPPQSFFLSFSLFFCCKAENALRCILSHGWRPAPRESIYCRCTCWLSILLSVYVCVCVFHISALFQPYFKWDMDFIFCTFFFQMKIWTCAMCLYSAPCSQYFVKPTFAWNCSSLKIVFDWLQFFA